MAIFTLYMEFNQILEYFLGYIEPKSQHFCKIKFKNGLICAVFNEIQFKHLIIFSVFRQIQFIQIFIQFSFFQQNSIEKLIQFSFRKNSIQKFIKNLKLAFVQLDEIFIQKENIGIGDGY